MEGTAAHPPLLVERDGSVAILTMNRPAARNALDRGLVTALGRELPRAAADPEVRAIVLTGSGGSFCAGADLKSAFVDDPELMEHLEARLDEYHAIVRAIANAPKPVVAAVDGPAVGFGCDLALACDLRVLSTRALLQEKFTRIGLMPDGGGTFWLARFVGFGRAMEIMMLAQPLDAHVSKEYGLANRVVPPDRLRAETLELAHALANGPPLALAGIKRGIHAGATGGLEASLAAERAGQLVCLRSQDCLEGVGAWMQKREPTFRGV